MKIQINISDELVAQLDKYAGMMGISRSALCATFIGQGVMSYNKSFELIDTLGQGMSDTVKESLGHISGQVELTDLSDK